jgi:COP9 signalosome complex subunit 3
LGDRHNQRLPKDVQPGGDLWKRAIEFLKVFDPIQVRYAGQEWRRLIELVAHAAQAASKARRMLSFTSHDSFFFC